MLNFKVVESHSNDTEEYEEFIQEYNKGTLAKDIRTKLGLNSYKYRKFRKTALEEKKITPRSKQENAKYYSKTPRGYFQVHRRNTDGKEIYYGTYKTKKEAQARVCELEKNNWKK